MELVVIAAALLVYNMVVAPLLGRKAIEIVDLIFAVLFIGIVMAVLKYAGIWERIINFHMGAQ